MDPFRAVRASSLSLASHKMVTSYPDQLRDQSVEVHWAALAELRRHESQPACCYAYLLHNPF